jgi:hypothetical protein
MGGDDQVFVTLPRYSWKEHLAVQPLASYEQGTDDIALSRHSIVHCLRLTVERQFGNKVCSRGFEELPTGKA